jgi:AcrR family transcriptional regulator
MNKFDLRFQKTEDLIIQAFLLCAAETDLDKIRIKDICVRAGISRNAFYAHYADKYELLESICARLETKMINGLTPAVISMMSKNQLNESTDWCVRMVYENREILRVLSNCSEERLRKLLVGVFVEGTLKALYDKPALIRSEPKLYMAANAVTNLLVSSLLFWLQHIDDISSEEMIGFVRTYMHEPCILLYRQINAHPDITPKF